MVADELKVLIRAETSKAVREMKKAQKGMERTHKSSQALVKNLLKQGAAWGSAVLSVRAVSAALQSSVEEYRASEEATRALTSAVERNPMLDGSSVASLEAFAKEMERTTTVNDRVVTSLAAQAAATGKSEDQIKDMIRAAVDMASVMDMDVQQAFDNLLGTFTGTAGELADFVPALDDMSEEALKSGEAVDVLRKQFDGFAEEAAQTSSGEMKDFQSALTSLAGAGGGVVLDFIEPAVAGLSDYVREVTEAINQSRTLRQVLSGESNLSIQDQINALLEDNAQLEREIAEYSGIRAARAREELERNNQRIRALEQQALMEGERAANERESADTTGETADNTEEIAVATAKWGNNLGGVKTLLSSVGDEANTVGRMWDTLTTESVTALADSMEDVGEETEEAKKTASDYINMASMGFSSLSGVVSAYAQLERQELEQTMAKYDERMDKLSEQHERQLEFAKARGASEQELTEIREQQEKEKEKLEEQKEKERKKAEKKAFKREKAMNIAETTMAGAQAFVQALTAGPVAGPILASAIAGMTAAQLSLISQQQYPGLASGGIVPAQGEGGGLYRLGDKNKAETVLPFDIRHAGGMGGSSVVFNGPVNAYGAGGVDDLAETINRSIRRQQKTGAIPA